MQIKDIVRRFDETRPNKLSMREKLILTAQTDRRLNEEILTPCRMRVELPADDLDLAEVESRKLLADGGYEEIYLHMLSAQCSLAEADEHRYNADVQEYMRLLSEYAALIHRICPAYVFKLSV